MARRQKKGRGQYSNRRAIPGADLVENSTSTTLTSTPARHIQQSRKTPRGHETQTLTPESTEPSDSPDALDSRGPSSLSDGSGASSRHGTVSPSNASKALNNRRTQLWTRYTSPPSIAPRVSAPSKQPWELNLAYPVPKRQPDCVSFNWPSVWLSFPGRDANLELQKELLAHRQFTLPLPLPSTGVAPERMAEVNNENKKIRSIYTELGQAALLDIRMENRNVEYDADLIFSSRLPSLNGLDNSHWSKANVPANLSEPAGKGVSRPSFFNILNIPDIWGTVLEHLKPSVRDLSAVAMTCKSAAVSMRGYFEVWDFHSGEFDVDNFMTKKDLTVEGLAKGKYIQRRGVRSNILLITGGHQHVTETPYSDSFESMLKLFKAVRLAPFSFQDVALHSIPFLDTRVLEVLIQGMPNLETLSISGCLLLDVTKLPRILNVILRNPRVHEAGARTRKSYIKVDFSPYRFFGPLTLERHGTFLITYHKPNFDIPKAATALLYRCLPDAKKVGMDLLGDGSSFWHFFRQLPGPCPLWAVKVRETIITQERFKHRPYNHEETMDNLCAAVSGDCRAPERLPARRTEANGGKYVEMRLPYGYWRDEKACPICRTTLSRCLFVNCAPNNGSQRCWGCHLIAFVNNFDHSHFRYRKKAILDHLFLKPPAPKATNPEDVTDDPNASTDADPNAAADASPNATTDISLDVAVDAGPNTNTATGNTARAGEGKAEAADIFTKDTIKEKFDDGGIFENTVFSVMSFSDPLGDENKVFDRKSGLMRRKFSYKVLNFMAQNIGVARRFAFMSDKAWNYYKGLKHGSSKPPYPELDIGEHKTHAGTIYRWTRFRNPQTGPSDYLHGGPQYMHPCHESAKPKEFDDDKIPKISFKDFKLYWTFRYGDLQWIRRHHLHLLETGKTQETDFLRWANKQAVVKKQRDAAVEYEWRRQHERDYPWHYRYHAQHEDAIWSLCEPNKVVYNLDLARMESERENARWNLRKYAHGHRR